MCYRNLRINSIMIKLSMCFIFLMDIYFLSNKCIFVLKKSVSFLNDFFILLIYNQDQYICFKKLLQ